MKDDDISINDKIAALNLNRSAISDKYGVSRSAFYSNIKRYDEGRFNEIAPGLLSFFRFVDEKAQTKNDVQKFLSNGSDPFNPSSTLFNVVSDDDGKVIQPAFSSGNPKDQSDILDKELCFRIFRNLTTGINSTCNQMLERYPSDVSRLNDGSYKIEYDKPRTLSAYVDKYLNAYSMMEILKMLSENQFLSDTGLTNITRAKEYIIKAWDDFTFIFEDEGDVFDENQVMSKVSLCNRMAEEEGLGGIKYYVAAIIAYNEDDSEDRHLQFYTFKMQGRSSDGCLDSIKTMLHNDRSLIKYAYHILGPYDLMSTADNVERYLSNDWRVTMSPSDEDVDFETAQSWLNDKVLNEALRRGLN